MRHPQGIADALDQQLFVRLAGAAGQRDAQQSEADIGIFVMRTGRMLGLIPSKKVEQLRFLERPDRTLGQAAVQWLLAEPRVMTVLPNIYDREQLLEFAKAPDAPALTADELQRTAALYDKNFGIDEPPMNFKGTMERPEVGV